MVSRYADGDAHRKKWPPVIIHCLLERGSSGFNDLETAIDGISSKVLSDSLEDLEDHHLINREIINEKPFRVQYTLFERGRSLEPIILAMRDWRLEHPKSPNEMNA